MMRAWIGVALLAGSWLLGTTYYLPANRPAWAAVVILGAVLLSGCTGRGPTRREAWVALLLMLPAAWFAPWPLRAAPLLVAVGLAAELLPIPRDWPRRLGRGAVVAGAVMFVQALAMAGYAAWTARCHELPRPLPELLAGVAWLLGIEATADGSSVVMYSIRQVHRLGATWDLLLDPPTLCLFVGSLVVLGLAAWDRLPRLRRLSAFGASAGVLTLAIAAWLPVRAGLLLAVYLHRVLRADYDLPLNVMDHFLSPWVLLLLLIAPVLLAWRLGPRERGFGIWDWGFGISDRAAVPAAPPASSPRPPVPQSQIPNPQSPIPNSWSYPAAAGLFMLAAGIFTAAVEWDPVGTPQAGRVKVVERHSTWEPTNRPYDTRWFGHDSGYNYASVYDYLSQSFEMSRLPESQRIDRAALADCDVLVIKTPTARYSPDEVEAVVRFVERGGGLLMIGDHTNVFKSGTYLNDVAREFGFTFRYDLLFGTGESPYDQQYVPPQVPHPIVQYLPPTDFAVSCSIDPGRTWGRAVVRAAGLWSMPPEYHILNYHPYPQHRPEIRYGSFIQLWSTRHGQGRVLAFGDSTIFSSFCTFQPGKAELMRGMVDWLNHRNAGDPCGWLLLVGLLPLAVGLGLARARHRALAAAAGGQWLVLPAAGGCGWVAAGLIVAAAGRWTMPPPQIKPTAEKPCVVIDRTTSQAPLSKGAFTQGDGQGYGLFEQWISRVAVPSGQGDRNLYTARRSGPDAFSGDALVVICPDRSVSDEFRQRLIRYVTAGGRLLVIDSPQNTRSTANSLLWPFGLSVVRGQAWRGSLTLVDDWPAIQVQRASEISGGRPIARLGQLPVAAEAYPEMAGKGTVIAVGFAGLFCDEPMGYEWTTQPNALMLLTYDTYRRYNVEFALLRALMTGQPPARFFMGRVVLDRSVSSVPLAAGPSGEDAPASFEGLKQWIPRLGYDAAEGSGDEAFSGDALAIVYPSGKVEPAFSDRLAQYVAAGGRLLVIDSPQNADSTANELLAAFGLSFGDEPVGAGRLLLEKEEGPAWPAVPIEPALPVDGGHAFAHLGATPVGATIRHGRGTVTAVGFGSLLNDASMPPGAAADAAPASLIPYDVTTAILRALMTDYPVAKSIPAASQAE